METGKNNIPYLATVDVERYDSDIKGFPVYGLDNNDEEYCLGKIGLDGEMHWENGFNQDNVAQADLGEINARIANLYPSCKDNVRKELEGIILNGVSDTLTVCNPDGKVDYHVERVCILDNYFIAVGMAGMGYGSFRLIRKNDLGGWDKDEVDEVMDWLLEDIASAVGEEWLIELD